MIRNLLILLFATALGGACTSTTGLNASGQAGGSCQFVTNGYGPAGTTAVHAEKWVTGLEVPWAVVFLPGGDALVTERPGRLRLISGGSLVPDNVATVQTAETGEGGLLGLAIHPNFTSNHFIYVYATVNKNGSVVNQIQRWVLSDNHRKATFDRIILDDIPSGTFHDGGRIKFGPDGKLYVGTGDGRSADRSQDSGTNAGKVLRVNDDGSIPTDNPESGKAWYIKGVRNVEGFDWLDSGTMVLSDHGPTGEYQDRQGGDELSLAKKGDNLGWPTIWHCETQPGMRAPILVWDTAVPPGGTVIYQGNQIPEWKGNIFIGTLGSTHLHRVVLGSDGNVKSHEIYFSGDSSNSYGRLRDVVNGPDGYLYVTTSNCDSRGSCPSDKDYILRIKAGA